MILVKNSVGQRFPPFFNTLVFVWFVVNDG